MRSELKRMLLNLSRSFPVTMLSFNCSPSTSILIKTLKIDSPTYVVDLVLSYLRRQPQRLSARKDLFPSCMRSIDGMQSLWGIKIIGEIRWSVGKLAWRGREQKFERKGSKRGKKRENDTCEEEGNRTRGKMIRVRGRKIKKGK